MLPAPDCQGKLLALFLTIALLAVWLPAPATAQSSTVTNPPNLATQADEPPGGLIAFDYGGRDGYGIAVIDSAGGSATHLVANGKEPTWSPDGSEIAYLQYTSQNVQPTQISLIKPDGTDEGTLWTGNGNFISSMAWSPTGTQMLVVQNPSQAGVDDDMLTMLTLQGTTVTGSASFPLPPLTSPEPDSIGIDQPSFSQDGKTVVLDINYAVAPCSTGCASQGDIWTEASDDSFSHLVARITTSATSPDYNTWWYAKISPDGKSIVANRDTEPSNQNNDSSNLWSLSATGTAETQLTQLPNCYDPLMPAWSPDGTKLVFTTTGLDYCSSTSTNTLSSAGIYIINQDGSGQEQILSSYIAFDPAWQPQTTGLKIEDATNGLDITDQSVDKVIGQQIALRVKAANGDPVTNVKWSIPTGGLTPATANVVTGYPLATATDSLYPSYLPPLTSPTTSFYWIRPNVEGYEVGVTGTVDGKQETAETTFVVSAPTVEMNSTTSVLGIANSGFGRRRVEVMELGRNSTDPHPGITFNFQATAPEDGAGQLGVTQLINDSLTHYFFLARPRQCISTQGFEVDNFNFLPGSNSSTPLLVPIGSGATAVWTSSDSPSVPLLLPTAYSRTTSFQTYLMYRPDGTNSIWVAIGELNWGFSGTARWEPRQQFDFFGPYFRWEVTAANNPNPANPSGTPSNELPTWGARYSNPVVQC